MQRFQLGLGIHGTHLSGLRNIHHTGLYHMRGHAVLRQHRAHPLRAHLALLIRDDQHLVPGGLYGAGLVDEDMAGRGAYHRLMRAQGSRQRNEIGLGAAG